MMSSSHEEGRERMMRRFKPNGLLPNEEDDSFSIIPKVLEHERWSRAEERAAELLHCVQPDFEAEYRRHALVSYLQRLITTSIPCQVFPLGSVPLKTYLPDGDIDLTALTDHPQLRNNLIDEVRRILENEVRGGEDAEFHVKEVQFITAEVKILKCLVDNFVVDISFNQLGGLCTLCFLEEVDNIIGRQHIFKRSIILVKSWCYYESRILGSQHGLLSTYAVETLVTYIFHVYNGIFDGPLEVLYRFLEFFSKFDWTNYCISLWGPVPIKSLPNLRAEPPRKDCSELLLDESFLNACMCCYSPTPSNQENQEQPFVSKYLNIVDPLRGSNNLGRSINKGSFFRIRSAFAYGAQQVERLLDCPEERLMPEFDFFFRNTWTKNGNGYWMPFSDFNVIIKNVHNSTHHEHEDQHQPQASYRSDEDEANRKPASNLSEPEHMIGTSDVSAVSEAGSSDTGTMTCEIKHANTMKNALIDQGQSSKHSTDEFQDIPPFARVHSIPEFAADSEQHRHRLVSESEISGQVHSASSVAGNSSRHEALPENQQSFGQTPEASVGHLNDEAIQRYWKEYAAMNNMETFRNPSLNRNLQAPVNASNSQDFVPFPATEFTEPSDYNVEAAYSDYGNNRLEQGMNNMRLYDGEDGNIEPQQEDDDRKKMFAEGTSMDKSTWQEHNSSIDTGSILAGSPSENLCLVPFDTEILDVLDSDFASHWANMQLGMLYLHGESKGLLLPSPPSVPPLHMNLLQRHPPLHVPSTLASANMNMMPQSFPLSHPVMPMGRGAAELPRSSRAGIGTYMLDPASCRLRYKAYRKKKRNFRPSNWRSEYKCERGNDSDNERERERSADQDPNPNMHYGPNDNHSQAWRRVDSYPRYHGSSFRGHFSGTKEDSYIGEGSHSALNEPEQGERDPAYSSNQPSSSNTSGDIKYSQPRNQDKW